MNLTVKAVNWLDVDRLLKETWTMESKPAKSWNGFHLNHFYFPAGVNELDWTFPSLSLQSKNQQKTKKSGTKVLYSSCPVVEWKAEERFSIPLFAMMSLKGICFSFANMIVQNLVLLTNWKGQIYYQLPKYYNITIWNKIAKKSNSPPTAFLIFKPSNVALFKFIVAFYTWSAQTSMK